MAEAAAAQRYERAAVLLRRRERLAALWGGCRGMLEATHARSRLVLARHPPKERWDAFWVVGRAGSWTGARCPTDPARSRRAPRWRVLKGEADAAEAGGGRRDPDRRTAGSRRRCRRSCRSSAAARCPTCAASCVPRPAREPATAARDETPSFENTWDRCVSTVFSDRKSSAAIWRLVLPARTSRPPRARAGSARAAAVRQARRPFALAARAGRGAAARARRRRWTAARPAPRGRRGPVRAPSPRRGSPSPASARPSSSRARAASIGIAHRLGAASASRAASAAAAGSPVASASVARVRDISACRDGMPG